MLSIDNSPALDYCKLGDNTLAASVAFALANADYTSAPTVAFSGGGGTGAAGTAVIENGVVKSVTITNQGSGYTSAPTVAFSSGGGSGATGVAVIDSGTGKVTGVTITNAGGQAVTFTDNTAYVSPDARKAVQVSVFDHFGAKAEAIIPEGSTSVKVGIKANNLNTVEGINAIVTVISKKGKRKNGTVHGITTINSSGNAFN